ncbi:type 1 glutamine amidotransferase [Coralloluteibacterium stylophorae]|uniref:Type 1 glutamine amidotransferase n=2 Tax=Coralloluteibacterium stylophorae TaxID=1776034 RepID=A0A8J7VQN6_9GAMM|nr:type 1 glutamine amidotransferase [Coralloluteibacterium stylophorae]
MLATNGFEEAELVQPRQALLDAGHTVTLAAPDARPIRGVNYDPATGTSPPAAEALTPDTTFDAVDPAAFDALVLPGGVTNPDTLRMVPRAIEIIRAVAAAGKPVASICHGPWLLIEADLVRGRRTTGWYTIRTDLRNAGSEVVDAEVVVDGNLITSRMPSDIPAFNRAILGALR